MVIFSCEKLQIAFGADILLDDLNFTVYEGDKLGIIGSNGCGKSTLIHVLLGKSDNFTGAFFRTDKHTIGYLPQNAGLESDKTVIEEFMLPYRALIELEHRIENCERQLKKTEDEAQVMALSEQVAAMYDEYVRKDGKVFRSRINSILTGLGFPEEIRGVKISGLSGGQKTRLALARLLESNPDVLILDEPTNHLDLASLQWLEAYLKDFKGTLMVISHDRYFLDQVTNKTLCLERKTAYLYKAPYSKFLALRAASRAREEKVTGVKLHDGRSVKVHFTFEEPGGKDVLTVSDLSYRFPDKILFQNLSFEIKKKERILLEGSNGCGKSTLLRILTDRIAPSSGSFRFGAGIHWSYYAQDLSDLNEKNTVFDEIWHHVNRARKGNDIMGMTEIRRNLGAFGFTGEDVYKKIASLSGGEKARVALQKIIYDHANLLILDEPTNHLDTQTREVLEEALLAFEGAILMVSHDRYFTGKIATRTVNMGQFSSANYTAGRSSPASTDAAGKDAYLKQKEQQAARRKAEAMEKRLSDGIKTLEMKIAELDALLSRPEVAADYERISELYQQKEAAETELDTLMEQYLALE